MSYRIGAAVQYLLPQKLLCRIVYRLSRSRQPWLKRLLIRGFLKLYPIDLDEAEQPDPEAYASFNEFFVRTLRDDARPLPDDDKIVVSPVDGTLTEFGRLDANRLIQAKGKTYTIGSLLGEEPGLLEPFDNGSFLTVYLAPHNYHRVHAPITGRVDRCRYVPGKRFSVNLATANAIDELFCRNERALLWLSTDIGYAVVAMIGALNVSSLTTILTGEIPSGGERLVSPESAPPVERGGELGRFNLGSTIVVVFQHGVVDWIGTLAPGQTVRMGQPIGRVR